MTVCDIRSDSFSITTSAVAWCEESAFVSTKQSSQSAEKKSDSDKKKKEGGKKAEDWKQRKRVFSVREGRIVTIFTISQR